MARVEEAADVAAAAGIQDGPSQSPWVFDAQSNPAALAGMFVVGSLDRWDPNYSNSLGATVPAHSPHGTYPARDSVPLTVP